MYRSIVHPYRLYKFISKITEPFSFLWILVISQPSIIWKRDLSKMVQTWLICQFDIRNSDYGPSPPFYHHPCIIVPPTTILLLYDCYSVRCVFVCDHFAYCPNQTIVIVWDEGGRGRERWSRSVCDRCECKEGECTDTSTQPMCVHKTDTDTHTEKPEGKELGGCWGRVVDGARTEDEYLKWRICFGRL